MLAWLRRWLHRDCTAGLPISRIEVLALGPDDVLVLSSRHKLAGQEIACLRNAIEQAFPGRKAVVLESDMTLSVVRERAA